MSGLDLITTQEQILAHIETQFSAYEVIEDYILNEQELLRVDSRVKPYIVISWDGLMAAPGGGAISGVRYDEYSSGFDIGVIAPTPKQCRRSVNIIVDNLIGWSYDDVSYLSPGGSSRPFVAAQRDGVPHLYMAMAEFTFPMNTSGIGAYITP